MVRVLVLVVLVLELAACSQPYWVQVAPPAASVEFFELEDLGANVRGYAVLEGERCYVVLRRGLGVDRDCTVAHELRHCDGLDHPNNAVHLGCNLAAPLLSPFTRF